MVDTCYSCEIFSIFSSKTMDFCSSFFRTVTPEMKTLLAYLFMAWFCYRLCQMLLGQMDTMQNLMKEFVDLSIATALLQTFNYWKGICFWIYTLGMNLGVRIIQITSENRIEANQSDINTLLQYVEDSFTPILSKIGVMVSDISWASFKISLGIIPIAVIYFLLLWKIFSSFFNIFVQLFAINLMAPVLCTFYALPVFKSAIWGTIRLLMTNALQIVLACGTIGIILTYLNSLTLFQENDVSISVGTVGYMQMLFTGSLLWGAYGTIMNTPNAIFNMGGVSSNNGAMTFAQNMMMKSIHTVQNAIPGLGAIRGMIHK